MRIGLWLFGAEVFCLQIGPLPADEQPSGDYKGDCLSTPIGFASTLERPDEAAHLPDRN